MVFNLPKYRIQ